MSESDLASITPTQLKHEPPGLEPRDLRFRPIMAPIRTGAVLISPFPSSMEKSQCPDRLQLLSVHWLLRAYSHSAWRQSFLITNQQRNPADLVSRPTSLSSPQLEA